MPCCGDREKGPVSLEEKWDYINLDDFKSESCLTPFSYFWVYYFLVVSLAVYGVDTFTAVNLLAFSRWAGQIEPTIPFEISRWIYAVCIIISFALLIYRWMHAIRAIRSGSIARSYLNSLAVRVQSLRPGKRGRGWKRFLVFAELTKSKKGAEYAALFTYFSFESWMNTVFADGPRQVVNAITLYSVMKMDLLPGGENAEKSSDKPGGVQFFENIKILADNNNLRAVVLCGMLFTLVVWVLSVIKLLIAIVVYLIFLFHHIPARDGTLSAYCRRKINTRLMRIVHQKVNKALAKGVVLQDRAPTQPNMGSDLKPTLPSLGNEADKGPMVTTISRSTTQTTLPPYASRPGTAAPDRQGPTLPDLSWSEDPPPLSRMGTQASAYSDSAALEENPAVSAYSPLDRGPSPIPPVPPLPAMHPIPSAMRSNTPSSRPPMNQPRITPAPTGTARSTPAAGYRNMTEASHGYGAYMPPNPPTSAPYRTYSPAPDPFGRSMTPGVAVTAPPEMGYPSRTFSPAVQSATGHPGYPVSSFTPINQTMSPAAAPAPYPDRTLSPMNPNVMGINAMGSVPARTMSPAPMSGTPQPGNYVAFDPLASQAPIQPSASPVHHPYPGQDGSSPLNGYRREPSPGPAPSARVQTPMGDQPLRPYRNDANF